MIFKKIIIIFNQPYFSEIPLEGKVTFFFVSLMSEGFPPT